MSTRSLISIRNDDYTFDAVYCHFDGYETGVGSKLSLYYKTSEIVRELISLGDMSCLGDTLDTCEFYTRRGEALHIYKNLTQHQLTEKALAAGCEYLYIFGQFTLDDEYKWACMELV